MSGKFASKAKKFFQKAGGKIKQFAKDVANPNSGGIAGGVRKMGQHLAGQMFEKAKEKGGAMIDKGISKGMSKLPSDARSQLSGRIPSGSEMINRGGQYAKKKAGEYLRR